MLSGGQGGQPGAPKDCMQDAKAWWANCPFFYKFIFVFTTIAYLTSWFTVIFALLFAQQPLRTVTKFFFWTCSTSFLVPRDLLNWLIGVYLVYQDGKRIEFRIGTAHYACEMFFKNTLIQIFYICVAYILYFTLGSITITIPSVGLFPTFMLFLTLRGLADPETERPFLCFPVLVKNKWYPWILYGIFALISQSLVPDVLGGIAVAYMEVYWFQGQILKISPQTLTKLENSCLFKGFKNRSDFILLSNAGGDGFEMQVPQQQQEQQQQAAQPQVSAFQGRGVSIGQGGGGIPILSQQPPAAVINPSQNQMSQSEQELRRQAALAAEARMNQQEEQQNQSQEPDDIDDLPDQNQPGYNQLNKESPKEDLL